jgi:hypothetical protein
MIVTDKLTKHLMFSGMLMLLFVVCNNNVEFKWASGGRVTQSFDSSTYSETILVKNMPKNKIKQSKTMVAYFDSVGRSINDLTRMSGIEYYSMSFYKSTFATRRYFVKRDPNAHTYNGNKTYLGSVVIMSCKCDSAKWNIHVLRNLGTAREYEYNGPDLAMTTLFDECRSYIPDDEKNEELVRYYMELRNRRKTENNDL